MPHRVGSPESSGNACPILASPLNHGGGNDSLYDVDGSANPSRMGKGPVFWAPTTSLESYDPPLHVEISFHNGGLTV